MFSISSRYADIDDTDLTISTKHHRRNKAEEKVKIKYKKRRFLPQYDDLETIREIQIKENDRLDNIASELLGDPELYWQICDTNESVMHPNDITSKPGRILKISIPSLLNQSQQQQ